MDINVKENIKEKESMEDEYWVIAPKGIFLVALQKAGLTANALGDKRAFEAWDIFEESMKRHGYLERPNEFEKKLP